MKDGKKVAFIARGLTLSGVGRFVTSMLAAWNNQLPDNINLIVFTDDKKFIKQYPNLNIVYIPRALYFIWDNFLLLSHLKKHRPRSVMYTKNVIPLTHLSSPWKKFVVVYDLGFFHPEINAYKWLDTIYMKLMTKASLRFADTIVTISAFTKSEIIRFLNIPARKIRVVYLGVGPDFHQVADQKRLNKVINKYSLHLPFIFYTGSLSPRKNIMRLVKAFHGLIENIPHHLYLVSGIRWNAPNIEQYITQNLLNDRVHLLPHLAEQDLISFYTLASAFVYPTLYEGFGLPVIEAQACSCVSIVSKSIPAREIVKRNLITINPTQINSISLGIVRSLHKKPLKKPLVRSWNTVAEEYLDVLAK